MDIQIHEVLLNIYICTHTHTHDDIQGVFFLRRNTVEKEWLIGKNFS